LNGSKHALEADPNHLWQRPLAARTDGTIYAGNMRFLAVQKLGWSEVPVVYEDLPDKEEDLRRLRDNASYGEDDDQAIAELLYHLIARPDTPRVPEPQSPAPTAKAT